MITATDVLLAALVLLFFYALYRVFTSLWELRKTRVFNKAVKKCSTIECIKQVAEDHEMLDSYYEIEAKVNKRMGYIGDALDVVTLRMVDETTTPPTITHYHFPKLEKLLKYLHNRKYHIHPNRAVCVSHSPGDEVDLDALAKMVRLLRDPSNNRKTDPVEDPACTIYIKTFAERLYTDAEKSILEETSKPIVAASTSPST